MDVFDDRIISVGLNAIGYTAAGLLWMIVYSAIAGRKKGEHAGLSGAAFSNEIVSKTSSGTPDRTSLPGKSRLEFVSFSEYGQTSEVRTADRSETTGSVMNRRHREEIIRLARQMLQSGETERRIKNRLL